MAECKKNLAELKSRLAEAHDKYEVTAVRIAGTAGMRVVGTYTQQDIWRKVEEVVKEVDFPQSAVVEARTLSKYDEAKYEFLAAAFLLDKKGIDLEGKMIGSLGLGGKSFQFGVQTTDHKALLDSYRIGADLKWEEISATGRDCDFGSAPGNCRVLIERELKKSVEEVLQRAPGRATTEQWRAADGNVVAQGALYYTRDFMRWLTELKGVDEALDMGISGDVSTPKELEDAAKKLCKLSYEQASTKNKDGKHHEYTQKDHIKAQCFKASFTPYVLKSLNIPDDLKILFPDDAVDWTDAFLMERNNELPESLVETNLNQDITKYATPKTCSKECDHECVYDDSSAYTYLRCPRTNDSSLKELRIAPVQKHISI